MKFKQRKLYTEFLLKKPYRLSIYVKNMHVSGLWVALFCMRIKNSVQRNTL